MNGMFLRLWLILTVVQKLVEDHGIDFPQTPTGLSNEDITAFCDVIRMPGVLVGGRMPDSRNEISIWVVKNFKLAAIMFKSMEHCPKPFETKCVNSSAVLQCKHQWKLEPNKTVDLKVTKVVKKNRVTTMENIVFTSTL